jgi:hypothetical protein
MLKRRSSSRAAAEKCTGENEKTGKRDNAQPGIWSVDLL